MNSYERAKVVMPHARMTRFLKWGRKKYPQATITDVDDDVIWAFIEWMLETADGDLTIKALREAPRQLWLDFEEAVER